MLQWWGCGLDGQLKCEIVWSKSTFVTISQSTGILLGYEGNIVVWRVCKCQTLALRFGDLSRNWLFGVFLIVFGLICSLIIDIVFIHFGWIVGWFCIYFGLFFRNVDRHLLHSWWNSGCFPAKTLYEFQQAQPMRHYPFSFPAFSLASKYMLYIYIYILYLYWLCCDK